MVVTHLDDIKSHTQSRWHGVVTQLQLCVPANQNACRGASYLCVSSICLFACLRAPAVSLLQRNARWRLKAFLLLQRAADAVIQPSHSPRKDGHVGQWPPAWQLPHPI